MNKRKAKGFGQPVSKNLEIEFLHIKEAPEEILEIVLSLTSDGCMALPGNVKIKGVEYPCVFAPYSEKHEGKLKYYSHTIFPKKLKHPYINQRQTDKISEMVCHLVIKLGEKLKKYGTIDSPEKILQKYGTIKSTEAKSLEKTTEIKRVSEKKSINFKKDDLWLCSVDIWLKGVVEDQGDLEHCLNSVAFSLANSDKDKALDIYKRLKDKVELEAIEQGEILGFKWNITHYLIEKQYNNKSLIIEDLPGDFREITEEKELEFKHLKRIGRKYLGKEYLRDYLRFVLSIQDEEIPGDLDVSSFFVQPSRRLQEALWYDRDYRELDDKSAWNMAKRIEAIDENKYPFSRIYSILISALVFLEMSSCFSIFSD